MQARETFSPANMSPANLDVIEETPPTPEAKAYTILTPNAAFKGITLNRQFVRGRTTTYDEKIARRFVDDYGYKCEPELPPLPVVHSRSKGRAKTYVRA
jgi:hypothetical protein